MVTIRNAAAVVALAAGLTGLAPAANAGHLVVSVGIGLPAIAVVARPYAYYGPYYRPALVGGPVYGYYGRPYYRYAPHRYVRGYAGAYRRW